MQGRHCISARPLVLYIERFPNVELVSLASIRKPAERASLLSGSASGGQAQIRILGTARRLLTRDLDV
jgi:hypothetical protein